jgi:deoxyribodipyrimidine photo-lyase
MAVALVWFRRDLRLDDNPALQAALDAGHVPVPVYLHAPAEEAPWAPGAASEAWLRRSLAALDASLRLRGSRLIVRSGWSSAALLQALIGETGACAVHWNRLYEPACVARDTAIEHDLVASGIEAESHNAALLFEPWTIATGQGEPYRVFTAFWRNARTRLDASGVRAAPLSLAAPDPGLASLDINATLPPPLPDWDRDFWQHWQPGEAGAMEMLDAFVDGAADRYLAQRDLPDRIGTSRLSPHLHFGEVSPRRIVERLQSRPLPSQRDDAEAGDNSEGYLRELGWREFSHHLLFHFPHTADRNLNPRFDRFPWARVRRSQLAAWQQGRTGVPLVDAGMRELWTTGWMHNRVRMVVASFLTKNLRLHWLHGARWFWDTLLDADLANNTQGWQWTAGTGADAAPYFRVFNPVTQARRFDPGGAYVRRWLPGFSALPDAAVFEPWRYPALLAAHAPDYPATPIVDLGISRARALSAYSASTRAHGGPAVDGIARTSGTCGKIFNNTHSG